MAATWARFQVVTWSAGEPASDVKKAESPGKGAAEGKRYGRCSARAANKASVGNAETVVSGFRESFRACYNRELATNAGLNGSIRYAGWIGPTGKVRRVQARGIGLPLSMLDCAGRVILNGSFAPPEGGGATIVIPITYRVQR